MIVKSQIRKVTVYSDRAEVTRRTENELAPGGHLLVFDMLPDGIESRSIQVTGHGGAILKDVKFRTVHFEEYPDSDLTALYNQESEFTDGLNEIDDRIKHSEQEKVFIENIAASITSTTGENYSPVVDPQKWVSMVEFYRSRLDSLDRDIRMAKNEKKQLQNKLDKISEEINEISGRSSKQKNQVEITIEMADAGMLALDMSYVVYGPSWEPVYNLSVASGEKIMTMAYNAFIQQNTSEDWDNVAIKLSTARPNICGQQPELTPWHISLYRPEKITSLPASAPSPVRAASMRQMFEAPEEEEFLDKTTFGGFEIAESEAETGITSVVFNVNGTNSIKSDNQQYRVTILIHDFSAEFRYSSVPKLSPYAYLKSKVKNDTDFPFLPGETNVFLDNNFIYIGIFDNPQRV